MNAEENKAGEENARGDSVEWPLTIKAWWTLAK